MGEGVLSLPAAFGRRVLAEGVEAAGRCRRLSQADSDLVCGYGAARPMPASGWPAWLAASRPDPCRVPRPALGNGRRARLYSGLAHGDLLAAGNRRVQAAAKATAPQSTLKDEVH